MVATQLAKLKATFTVLSMLLGSALHASPYCTVTSVEMATSKEMNNAMMDFSSSTLGQTILTAAIRTARSSSDGTVSPAMPTISEEFRGATN